MLACEATHVVAVTVNTVESRRIIRNGFSSIVSCGQRVDSVDNPPPVAGARTICSL